MGSLTTAVLCSCRIHLTFAGVSPRQLLCCSEAGQNSLRSHVHRANECGRQSGSNPARRLGSHGSTVRGAIRCLATNRTGAPGRQRPLRPLAWVEDEEAVIGQTIFLDLKEIGVNGPAEVVSVEETIVLPGTGRLVTGVFRHMSGSILDLQIKGEHQPLGTTKSHPFWSVDREDWIPARHNVGKGFRWRFTFQPNTPDFKKHSGNISTVFLGRFL